MRGSTDRDLLLPNYPSGKQIIRRGVGEEHKQIETARSLSSNLFRDLVEGRRAGGMERPNPTG